MKQLFWLLFLVPLKLQADPGLMVGDVLLQPLDCWTCGLIEEEENTIYSHIGLVVSITPELRVAEAFGKVRASTWSEFNSKTQKGQKIKVIRFQNERVVRAFSEKQASLQSIFRSDFENRSYDHDFLWHNFDESGEEKFYCSELVSKLIQAFIGIETPLKRMHFDHYREKWNVYFRGKIPDGEWGNSPGDFERSELFYTVGER